MRVCACMCVVWGREMNVCVFVQVDVYEAQWDKESVNLTFSTGDKDISFKK